MIDERSTSTPPTGGATGDEIVATAASSYRRARYIMAAIMIAMGGWFAYDGWKAWPEENRRLAEIKEQLAEAQARGDSQAITRLVGESKELSQHSDTDILLQKLLAVILPPAGIALLIWSLYNSRGAYRLSAGNTLHIPGHPPITLDQVRGIDRSRWDKKGIAYVDYETPQQRGRLKLDDFIYERTPTDEIFNRIEQHLNPPPLQA